MSIKDGILIINKPTGITSHNCISKLRYLLKQRKIGHCGTLDPMASGVLPIMIGSAVKASEFLVDHDKRYYAGIKLGVTTDTQDITGNIISEHNGALPSFEEFAEVAKSFQGEILQTPPMYSALKVGGVKLLNLAREGVTVEREARRVNIYSCEPSQENGEFFLDVKCSRGTYIRTLCADIGEKLGCGACMSSLVRTEVEVFRLEDAVVFDDLNDMTPEEILSHLIPTEKMFMHLPEARMDDFFDRLYHHGESIRLGKLKGIYGEVGDLFRVYDKDGFYSIGEIIERDGKKHFRQKKLFR
ncbi:MAG: tRNA pseudouridine(55) synthase TruB [Ruminococcaceae bacterium]|nr:tRNA pseudouridine(55) synthase TruB [Oscillospiraceae bacterium]